MRANLFLGDCLDVLRGFEDGDVVLDTFMGSGTTGVACIVNGRKFAGIEKCPAFFEIAQRRIDSAEPAGLAAA